MLKFPPAMSRRFVLAAVAALCLSVPAKAQDTLKLGLVAAMSGQSAKSGEAIVRGLSIAIDEINAKGGVLGKKLELVVRDDESNPAKGLVAARELVQRENVAAFFGGLDRDRALRQSVESTVHGRLGGGDADHQERRGRELRVPCLGRG
jgi:branched-chain amino acid transport system substrate-binding protein